jgi:hypothetical protein
VNGREKRFGIVQSADLQMSSANHFITKADGSTGGVCVFTVGEARMQATYVILRQDYFVIE